MTSGYTPIGGINVVGGDSATVLRDALQTAAAKAGAAQALLVWEDADEAMLEVAHWDGSILRATRESPASILPLVTSEMADVDFVALDAGEKGGTVLRWQGQRPEWTSVAPVNPRVALRFGFKSVVAVRVRGDRVNGRLLLPAANAAGHAELNLAVEAAAALAATLDRGLPERRVRSSTLIEERQRLSHELHDGVLQSLTGVGFRLKTVESLIETDPEAARAALREVQNLLVEEQREIRVFVMGLRELDTAGPVGTFDGRLARLIRRIESVWSINVTADVTVGSLTVAPRCEHEILRIVQEAIVNGVRHGGSTAAQVRVERVGDDIRIVVSDNGRGFPFKGRYELAALQALRIGPVTLKARVQALGASLEIDSTPKGATIEIGVPIQAAGERGG